MRIILNDTTSGGGSSKKLSATTFTEMLVTMGLFSIVVTALVYTHIFGLKQDELVESKLGASDHARKGFGIMSRDIRSSAISAIGTYSGSSFVEAGMGASQTGNAIRLYMGYTTNSTVYLITNIYYFDTSIPSNNRLLRTRNNGTPKVIAQNLINSLTFSAEDFAGNPVTDNYDRRIIRFTLDFQQYQYPLTKVGTNGSYLYDRYKMEFRVTPHVPQGR
jgi:hypothetical protein